MKNTSNRLLAATLVFAALISLIPLLAPRLMTGALAIPTITIIVTLTALLLITIVKGAQRSVPQEKRKHDEEALDAYDEIDRLVDTLNAEELEYLRHRIEQHSGRTLADDGPSAQRESSRASANGTHPRKVDRA